MAPWLETPPGRYVLAWEQAGLDEVVADLFGFHALQLGLSEVQALRANRMPHRWVMGGTASNLWCEPEALPFEDRALDLVVLPHTLEQAQDPHRSLAEVARVLRPEGRVVITGLNPVSLWGLRRQAGRVAQRMGWAGRPLFLPRSGELMAYWRLRDWLRLLGFELEVVRLGCYRPPLWTQPWLDRWSWMERSGERWWPVFGAAYLLVAVKRVRGMRLIGLARSERARAAAAPATVANRQLRLEAGVPEPQRTGVSDE